MVRIIESSGYHRLDNAALQALKKSSFISKFEKILNIIGWLNAHSNRFSDDLPNQAFTASYPALKSQKLLEYGAV